jgi:enamine deaminase RidA (YjgF/YER057c/UK114 family)
MNYDLILPSTLPTPGQFVHLTRAGDLIFLAGKGPLSNDTGKVGREIPKERAYELSREIGLRLLGILKQEIDDLRNVDRCIKVNGYVNCVDGFDNPTFVINGCSDLFIEVFGENGKHSRTSIGVSGLFENIPVEIDAIFKIK